MRVLIVFLLTSTVFADNKAVFQALKDQFKQLTALEDKSTRPKDVFNWDYNCFLISAIDSEKYLTTFKLKSFEFFSMPRAYVEFSSGAGTEGFFSEVNGVVAFTLNKSPLLDMKDTAKIFVQQQGDDLFLEWSVAGSEYFINKSFGNTVKLEAAFSILEKTIVDPERFSLFYGNCKPVTN